ncbi:MAG TPA: cupin domain-containing protein [Thermoanaerobaculia bacterium]|nr:cupin domain-containing protein [Thermoanaerobaculia bacterium]
MIELEGGCRVTMMFEGAPVPIANGRIWRHFESKLSLRVIELSGDATLGNSSHDEVLYELAKNEGIYIPAGASMMVTAGTYVSALARTTSSQLVADNLRGRPTRVRLDDQPRQKTADRWYVELVQAEVTQFVGSIPPGRAPDHFHLYEEVIVILDGDGVMHAGEASAPVQKDSCIFLPIRQRHCLENTGSGELRLLGVFYPAGSPAVRYTS